LNSLGKNLNAAYTDRDKLEKTIPILAAIPIENKIQIDPATILSKLPKVNQETREIYDKIKTLPSPETTELDLVASHTHLTAEKVKSLGLNIAIKYILAQIVKEPYKGSFTYRNKHELSLSMILMVSDHIKDLGYTCTHDGSSLRVIW
jgi:hypothetical protein